MGGGGVSHAIGLSGLSAHCPVLAETLVVNICCMLAEDFVMTVMSAESYWSMLEKPKLPTY
jgi:hypothetical protein